MNDQTSKAKELEHTVVVVDAERMDLALQSGQTQVPAGMNREDKRAFILAQDFKDKVEANRGHSEGHEPLGGILAGKTEEQDNSFFQDLKTSLEEAIEISKMLKGQPVTGTTREERIQCMRDIQLSEQDLNMLIQHSQEPSFEIPSGLDREQRREFCKKMLNEEDWTNI